jgi:hypothetical protein
LISEPGVPQLVLLPADSSGGSQRVDSDTLKAAAGTQLSISVATDGSGATISYGEAADYVDSDGMVHGPFALATVGLLSITAAVALENGAGAVLLGMGAGGPGWVTLGPAGFGTVTTFNFGETADVTQPAPVLWDDGSGNLSAVLPLSYEQGKAQGLFVARGTSTSGSPFSFSSPVRLDTEAPGTVNGFEVSLGPTGALGVLLGEGTSELAGFAVAPDGTVSGGTIATLASAVTLQAPAGGSVPWYSGCGAGGSCDPQLRFADNGDLVVAWSLGGDLTFARLPPLASAWRAPQAVTGGPLLTPLATDGAGDVAGLAQVFAGDAIALASAVGAPSLEALPQASGLIPGPFAAATTSGAGALWGAVPTEPGEIFGWTFSLGGGAPAVTSPARLPGGEHVSTLVAAAPTVPSSVGDSFFGTASPGWMLIGGSLDGSFDVLLSAFVPTTGALGPPMSVAVPGWQESSGVTNASLFVDGQGTALVAFTQSVGSAGPNLFFSTAEAGAAPSTACYAVPPVANSGLALYVDQNPYGPALVTGSGHLLVSYDAPATISLAE